MADANFQHTQFNIGQSCGGFTPSILSGNTWPPILPFSASYPLLSACFLSPHLPSFSFCSSPMLLPPAFVGLLGMVPIPGWFLSRTLSRLGMIPIFLLLLGTVLNSPTPPLSSPSASSSAKFPLESSVGRPKKPPVRLCDNCGATLPARRQRFCTDGCSKTFHKRKYRAKKREQKKLAQERERFETDLAYQEAIQEAVKNASTVHDRPAHSQRINSNATRGRTYHKMLQAGMFPDIESGKLTQRHAARLLGVSPGTVAKSYTAYLQDKAQGEADAQLKALAPTAPDFSLDNLPALEAHFARFRTEYFQTPEGTPYLFPTHQRRWFRSIIRTMVTGGRQMVLSPPRHGKTELLAHFCTWMIACVNPNIRILVVGGNEDIAANTVGMVRDQLENNEPLIRAYAPTGQSWKPRARGGLPWTNSKFTVETRTVAGIAGATMTAIGRGGRILSRNADIIICDDIEDPDSTNSEGTRESTRRWFAIGVSTRKVETTGLFVIGSRQHPDDLYQHLIDDELWDSTVEQMHSDDCMEDPEDESAHVDCMLWPEVRSYSYMRSLEKQPLIRPFFQMMYLNRPQDEGTSTFPKDLVDSCQDPHRATGHIPDDLPAIRLIAGLDPAGSGYQAVFLWAVDVATGKRYAVDFINHLGGGLQRARQQIADWFEKYKVRFWVVEENLYQGAIVKDEILSEYASRRGITLEPMWTYGNKWDPQLGVSSLANHMEAGNLSIPWKGSDTQDKWMEYRRQLINFSRETTKRTKTDIVMASWFPEQRITSWVKDWQAATVTRDNFAETFPFDDMTGILA